MNSHIDTVHSFGQLDVESGQTELVIGVESDIDGVPKVGPVRVVLVRLGYLGRLGHEEECGLEVVEDESSLDAVAKLSVLY